MQRRATTLGVASAILIALIFVAYFLIHVPYVILTPGPLTDTIGAVPAGALTADQTSGAQVITITGAKEQPSSGHLYLTTVGIEPGSCSANPTFGQALSAWWNSHDSVVPKEVECPKGQSSDQVQQQVENEMRQSQAHAVYAAMTYLGYRPTGSRILVGTIESDAPAAGVLHDNDQILTVDGAPVTTHQEVVAAVQKVAPGRSLAIGVDRAGAHLTLNVPTTKSSSTGKALIGITTVTVPTYSGISVAIGIDPASIGGPSAGTALALGIVDKLTPGGLTGGKTIAGTGTISRTGKVGPIGGIQQKIAAAASAHASVFFAPASECSDAKAVAPASLTLIRAETLSEVVAALKTIKSGGTAFPHC